MSDSKISDLIIDTLNKETDVSFLNKVQLICGERLREKSRAEVAEETMIKSIIKECDRRIDAAVTSYVCSNNIIKIQLCCGEKQMNKVIDYYNAQGFGAYRRENELIVAFK